jgi:hypothetical protein
MGVFFYSHNCCEGKAIFVLFGRKVVLAVLTNRSALDGKWTYHQLQQVDGEDERHDSHVDLAEDFLRFRRFGIEVDMVMGEELNGFNVAIPMAMRYDIVDGTLEEDPSVHAPDQLLHRQIHTHHAQLNITRFRCRVSLLGCHCRWGLICGLPVLNTHQVKVRNSIIEHRCLLNGPSDIATAAPAYR